MLISIDAGEFDKFDSKSSEALAAPKVDCLSIACGFHAGNATAMRSMIKLAIKNKNIIGAHPSFLDRKNFGRIIPKYDTDDIENIVAYQFGALANIAKYENLTVDYIKAHGALYNVMHQDIKVFEIFCKIAKINNLKLTVLATSIDEQKIHLINKYNIKIMREGFADRLYCDDGNLVKRSLPKAVHNSVDLIINQAKTIINDKYVKTESGKNLNIDADILCLHGDNPVMLKALEKLRTIYPKN